MKIDRINFRNVFLTLLVFILVFRFARKMLNDYGAWDFFPLYYAAKNILAKVDIYTYVGLGGYYTRSPILALMLYPLGLLSRNISSFVWCLLSIVSLGIIFIISEKLFLRNTNKNNFFWIVIAPITLIFLSRPLISQFLLGQSDILMLCLIMVALFFRQKDKLILTALFFAIAISIKLTPLVFLLYFLLKKEMKLVGLVFFFLLLFIFIPAIFVGWRHNLMLLSHWYNRLKFFNPNARDPASLNAWYQSLLVFFRRFLFSDKFNLSLFKAPPKFADYLYYSSFLAINILLILKPKNMLKHIGIIRSLIDYNILIIAMTIFSPLATDYSYINLIVPLIFLLYLFREKRLYKKPVFSLAAVLFLIFNFFTGSKAFRWMGIHQMQGEPYVYLIFMTLVWQALILLCLLVFLRYKIQKAIEYA